MLLRRYRHRDWAALSYLGPENPLAASDEVGSAFQPEPDIADRFMAIAVTCTHCGVKLRFKSEHAGKKATCAACDHPLVVQGQTIPDHDAFISYSSKDANVANAVCAALEARKIRCWMAPRDVMPGKPWAGAVLDAISDSRVMVLIYSGNANSSPQVIREVDRAVTRSVVLIPFRIEAAAMSKEMEYYIAAAHWLDATSGPMENHIDKLAAAVRRLLNDGAVTATPTSSTEMPESEVMAGPPASGRSMGWLVAVVLILLALAGGWWGAAQWLHRPMLSLFDSPQPIVKPAVPSPLPVPAASKPTTAPMPVVVASHLPVTSVTTRAASAPSAPAVPLPPGAIDLLANVHLPDDVVGGTWKRTNDGLHCDSSAPGEDRRARLRLPYRPRGEYDFAITFSRKSGSFLVGQILSYDAKDFAWLMGREQNTYDGFELVDNMILPKNRTAVHLEPALVNGQRYTSVVKVRKDSISAYIDGKLVSVLNTDYSNLTIGKFNEVGEGFLGLVAETPTDIYSAYVVPYAPPSIDTKNPSMVSHLWAQANGSLQAFVNGQPIPCIRTEQFYDFAVQLMPGDSVVLRIKSVAMRRSLRFSYVDKDHTASFVGTLDNTKIVQVSNLTDPITKSPSTGQRPVAAPYGPRESEGWRNLKLPDEAKPISLPEANIVYDVVFTVPANSH